MASLARETPAEDVRNALTLLRIAVRWHGECPDHRELASTASFARADYEAIAARLEAAVGKLEARATTIHDVRGGL